MPLKRSRAVCVGLSTAVLAIGAAHARAQNAPRPGYEPLRYDEDWSRLCGSDQRVDRWDPIKCIGLGSRPGFYASVGGDTRHRYERYAHPTFGSEPDDRSGYYLQRTMLHLDAHLGRRARVFTQLQSSLEAGRVGGPRPTDENRLDLHQAFVDLTAGGVTLRAGRQEFEFGTARILSTRDGLNARLTMDAVRAFKGQGTWRASVHVLRPLRDARGVFDDRRDATRTLWGGFVARVKPNAPVSGALYYLGFDRDQARFDQGVAHEQRHTLGVRLFGRRQAMDFNWEMAVQVGRFGSRRIRAWDLATDTGVSFRRAPGQPRVGLRVDVTSGDRDRNDGLLGTFNAVFAGTAYSGLAGLVGPANAIDVAPSVTFKPGATLTVTAGTASFWRYTLDDGLYGIAVNLLRTGALSRARHIGNQATVQIAWAPTRHVTLNATGSYFDAGRFLRETPPGRDVPFVTTWILYRF